jgi:hypothetical protein
MKGGCHILTNKTRKFRPILNENQSKQRELKKKRKKAEFKI